jgi:hypothetical protein
MRLAAVGLASSLSPPQTTNGTVSRNFLKPLSRTPTASPNNQRGFSLRRRTGRDALTDARVAP